MIRFVLVCQLLGCGGDQKVVHDRVTRPRAEPPWVVEGGCIPKKVAHVGCVTVTIADAAQIRDALRKHLGNIGDIPDKNLAVQLAEAPLAQWTVQSYRFAAAGEQKIELEANDTGDTTIVTGFRAQLTRGDSGWSVDDLVMFAKSLPKTN